MLTSAKSLGEGQKDRSLHFKIWLIIYVTMSCSNRDISGFSLRGKAFGRLGNTFFLQLNISNNILPEMKRVQKEQKKLQKLDKFALLEEYWPQLMEGKPRKLKKTLCCMQNVLPLKDIFLKNIVYSLCTPLKKNEQCEWRVMGSICQRQIFSCNSSRKTLNLPHLKHTSIQR